MQNKLYGFSCRLLGNPEDARDAVQEIYVKLWKLKSKLNNYKNLEAFAMTMTRNHCIDRIRARRTVSIEDQFSRTDRLADREQTKLYTLPKPQCLSGKSSMNCRKSRRP